MKLRYSHRPNAYRCLIVTEDGLLHCDPGFIVSQQADPANTRWTQFCREYEAATNHSTHFTSFTFQGVTFRIKSCNDGDHNGVGVDSGLICTVNFQKAAESFGFQLYDETGAVSNETILKKIADYKAERKAIDQVAKTLGIKLRNSTLWQNDDYEVVKHLTDKKTCRSSRRQPLTLEQAIRRVHQARLQLPQRKQAFIENNSRFYRAEELRQRMMFISVYDIALYS